MIATLKYYEEIGKEDISQRVQTSSFKMNKFWGIYGMVIIFNDTVLDTRKLLREYNLNVLITKKKKEKKNTPVILSDDECVN